MVVNIPQSGTCRRFGIALVRRLVEERLIAETPLIQELLREWTEPARRGATEQGRVQGRAEGELEAAIHIAQRIARARFGVVPAAVEQRLRALEHDQREAAIERLTTVESLEQWLQALT
jgi:predicted transposase YdaD